MRCQCLYRLALSSSQAHLSRHPTHFLDHTARNPKVKLLTMAKMKPPQLKLSSAADAIATPACSSSTGVTHEPRPLHCNDAGLLSSVDRAAAEVNKSRIHYDDTKGALHPSSREAGSRSEGSFVSASP